MNPPRVVIVGAGFDGLQRSKALKKAPVPLFPAVALPERRFFLPSDTVRAEGFEPSSSFEHRLLRPTCLPFHHARGTTNLAVSRFHESIPVATSTYDETGEQVFDEGREHAVTIRV